MKLSLKDYEKALYEFGEEINNDEKMHDIITHLIKVIYANNHDVAFLESLVKDYEEFYDKQKHITRVEITTAHEISDDQKEEILKDVKELFELEEVNPVYVIDSSIIGGVVLKSHDKLVDASIKGKLNKLKEN